VNNVNLAYIGTEKEAVDRLFSETVHRWDSSTVQHSKKQHGRPWNLVDFVVDVYFRWQVAYCGKNGSPGIRRGSPRRPGEPGCKSRMDGPPMLGTLCFVVFFSLVVSS
jgi:hypothetical protein